MQPYYLSTTAYYRNRPVTIIGRCFLDGWVYQIRFASGKIVDYVPHRMLVVGDA